MTTKIDTAAAATATSSSPKVSKFASKAGFVIPKNKLSGSLVPIFRGSGKADSTDAIKEESNQQACRKTKWGVDLTQDSVVRKCRILAYQTRLEQITEQLRAGALAIGDDQSLKSPSQSSSDNPSKVLLHEEHDNLKQLELEKREVIGEVLRLNPSYKAPPDYKPLLKEDKVPVPIKAYPGYNFIGLLLGPESNSLKRLEEETGVKVRVYGIMVGTREKREITQSDSNEAQSNYEELFVYVSAESFEKVDAAIALIELLVTPVSVNSAVAQNSTNGDNLNVLKPNQKDLSSEYTGMPIGTISQAAVQPGMVSDPMQYQAYPTPWYPTSLPNAPIPSSSGLMPPSVPNVTPRFPSSPVNFSNAPPFFGVHPPFSSVPGQSPGFANAQPRPPLQALQRPMNPALQYQALGMVFQPPPSANPAMHAQPTSNMPVSFPIASQTVPTGGMPATRPSLSQIPQSSPMLPISSVANRPSAPAMPLGNSSGWSSAPFASLPPRPNNMQVAPPSSVPFRRPHAINPLGSVVSLPSQQNTPAQAAGIPPATSYTSFAAFPQVSNIPPSFSSVVPPSGPTPVYATTPSSIGPSPAQVPSSNFTFPIPRPSLMHVSAAGPQTPVSGSTSGPFPPSPLQRLPLPVPFSASGQLSSSAPPLVPLQRLPAMPGSASNSSPKFAPVNSSVVSSVSITSLAGLMPPRPSSENFTFQPIKNPASDSLISPTSHLPVTAPRAPGPQNTYQGPLSSPQASLSQNASPRPVAAPQAASFRPAMQDTAIPVGAAGLPEPQAVGHMGQMQTSMLPPASACNFPSNSVNARPPPRFPHFPVSQNATPIAPVNQRGPLSFFPQAPNASGSAPMRPPALTQPPNPLPPANQPRGYMVPSQHFGNNNPSFAAGRPASSPGGNQIYDPFSPTSIPSGNPQSRGAPRKAGKPETDAEYEDLMASMGVR